ncbi:hypothetical protein Tco_0730292 [Tanacetum coccineum]|uniref:Uncharacterized protein n=1 Tax=Tanacetum coccineum TaxID=301880 RepID=A0ABQ4YSK9_9ASTR
MGRPTAQTRNTSQTPTNNVREAMQIRMNNGHVFWMNNGMIMDVNLMMNGQQHGCKRRQEDGNTVRNQVILKAGDTIDEFGWDNK